MKKTVDDQVTKQKAAASANKVLTVSWCYNALSSDTSTLKCASSPFMFSAARLYILCCSITALLWFTGTAPQDKKKAELERQKELAELFAVAIKQPKVPAGVQKQSIVRSCQNHKAASAM